MRRTLKDVLAEYGAIALVVYLAIFVVVLASFLFAIRLGFRPESTAGGLGTLAAAYIATKVTQPLRIAGALLLTPLVARLWERWRPRPAASQNGPGAADD
ncbi:MAG TPA: hypothetical protein VFG84_06485 [Gemmatimonadaceae bacterium]|nr:hypothetical protein [Gemmatimonadaceae bacterium]